jgi:lysozyme
MLNLKGENLIPGIDVSKWQGEIDWSKVANSGVRFAYIKATEGTGYTDPCFAVNWQSAKSAGVLRGAYHFFHPRLDARSQAKTFYATLGNDPGELPSIWKLQNLPDQPWCPRSPVLSRNLKVFPGFR